MNPRLLEYYNRELAYLRELGAEFAAAFPKVAGRLSLRELEVADPYVERLLEGFSFLTARVQMKMNRMNDTLAANQMMPGTTDSASIPKGGFQPPRNSTVVMPLIKIMFMYSPRKNSAKVIDEYSTL